MTIEDAENIKMKKDCSEEISFPKCKLVFPEVSAIRKEMEIERGVRSAPNSRSCSFKNKPRTKGLLVATETQRRNSMPQTTDNLLSVSFTDLRDKSETLERVRSFKMTSKGIINRGDSFRRKSNSSIASTGSAKLNQNDRKRQRIPSDNSDETACSCESSITSPGYFRVIMLGSQGVGKTALTNQFMTSEYIGAFDICSGDLDDEMTVSVQIDGEESTIEFIDASDIEDCLESLNVDAYVVVFSINNRDTYDTAMDTIQRLRVDIGSDRVIIMVANKVDLVRKRVVTAEEAKKIAESYNCKYTETSVALNHRVDELLVGIIRQIRLKLNPEYVSIPLKEISVKPKQKKSSKGPKGLLNKLFKKNTKYDKSCENLYEL